MAIDFQCLQELQLRLPLPRRLHARAIDRLRRAGAREVVYDIQFTEETNPSGRQRAVRRDPARRQRGAGYLRGARGRRHRRAGRSGQPARRARPGGQRGAVGGRLRPRDPSLRARHRWAGQPGRGGGRAGRRPRARAVPSRRRLDRLPRPAGHDRHRPLLRPAGGPRAGRAAARQDRGGRRDRPHREGRARHARVGRGGHGRRRDPGPRAGHDPARLPAARAPGRRGGAVRRAVRAGDAARRRCASGAGRGWRSVAAVVAGADRLPGVPGRPDRAVRGAAGRAGGGHPGHAGGGPGHGRPRARAHARGVRPLRARPRSWTT